MYLCEVSTYPIVYKRIALKLLFQVKDRLSRWFQSMKLIINTYTDECEGVKHCFLKRKTMLSLKENIALHYPFQSPVWLS